MGPCSGGGRFADSEKWTPSCVGPILCRWIYFVGLKCRDRAVEGNAVCSAGDRNRTVPLCELNSELDVERWICHGKCFTIYKPAELFQVWLYLKTIHLLDFPVGFWFKSTGFLSYTYVTVKYIKACLWIVVKALSLLCDTGASLKGPIH